MEGEVQLHDERVIRHRQHIPLRQRVFYQVVLHDGLLVQDLHSVYFLAILLLYEVDFAEAALPDECMYHEV